MNRVIDRSEPAARIELATSPVPGECSTTELNGQIVEAIGLEPTVFSLQSCCTTNCATPPWVGEVRRAPAYCGRLLARRTTPAGQSRIELDRREIWNLAGYLSLWPIQRPVRRSNPSHSGDNRAASPDASRGNSTRSRTRTCVNLFRKEVPFHWTMRVWGG